MTSDTEPDYLPPDVVMVNGIPYVADPTRPKFLIRWGAVRKKNRKEPYGVRHQSALYFMRRGADGPVKIGVSAVLRHRAWQLSMACGETVEILAFIPGLAKLEKVLHAEFAEDRLLGEWFKPSERLFARIETLKADAAKWRESLYRL